MKRIFAFDLDGTLIDTTGTAFRRINKNLENLGLPSLPNAILRKYWGKKVKKLFHFICKKAGANKEQSEEFLKKDLEIVSNFKFEVSKDLLFAFKKLKKSGILLVLITSRSSNSLKKIAESSGDPFKKLMSMFDFIQTSDSYKYKKPDGRVFKQLLSWAKEKSLEAKDIVYFGDTVQYDLKATKKSKPKIDFIAVSSGFNDVNDFIKSGVKEERIISSFEEVPMYLIKIIVDKEF